MLSQIVTTQGYYRFLHPLNIMYLKPSNVLIFALLIGGVGHVMIIQNGYWNDAMWISIVLSVAVPIAVYRYLKISGQKKKVRQSKKYAEF